MELTLHSGANQITFRVLDENGRTECHWDSREARYALGVESMDRIVHELLTVLTSTEPVQGWFPLERLELEPLLPTMQCASAWLGAASSDVGLVLVCFGKSSGPNERMQLLALTQLTPLLQRQWAVALSKLWKHHRGRRAKALPSA